MGVQIPKGKAILGDCPAHTEELSRCLSRPARIRGRILSNYTSYDVFPCNEVPFIGVASILLHILVVTSPEPDFGGVNRHFQA